MTTFSIKTAALTALIVLGSFSAQAGILHTADGTPVLTAEGTPVLTGTDGAVNCADANAPVAAAVAPAAFDHERVVFFDFNKSDLTKHARHQLNHLAKKSHAQVITVVGFADRIGNAAANEKLAFKRAKTVRDYLVAKGVKAKKVEVRSLGKSAPRANCAADLPRAKLIECLSEDRRVEIEFSAAK